MQGMSDTQLQDSCEDLYKSIEDWIESRFGEVNNLHHCPVKVKNSPDINGMLRNTLHQKEVKFIAGNSKINIVML